MARTAPPAAPYRTRRRAVDRHVQRRAGLRGGWSGKVVRQGPVSGTPGRRVTPSGGGPGPVCRLPRPPRSRARCHAQDARPASHASRSTIPRPVARGGSPSRRRATSGSRAAKSAPLTGARTLTGGSVSGAPPPGGRSLPTSAGNRSGCTSRADSSPGTGPELRRIRALLRRQRLAALRGGWGKVPLRRTGALVGALRAAGGSNRSSCTGWAVMVAVSAGAGWAQTGARRGGSVRVYRPRSTSRPGQPPAKPPAPAGSQPRSAASVASAGGKRHRGGPVSG